MLDGKPPSDATGKSISEIGSILPSNLTLETMAGKIIGAMQWIGTIIGVIVIAILGIKYMMGSIEEKADYKKSLVPLFIGAVILITAVQIVALIFKTI